eukprot:TRINITY_DN5304_c0_g1_i1.p1 TRINITY_DN5304_c0_g1~~TRINITY_DN5304_c0_g1_i1.p1  ORF type:complete len:245 (-),score=53.69 TRINITY_DN5304_c0_g1_i1:4-738(-)
MKSILLFVLCCLALVLGQDRGTQCPTLIGETGDWGGTCGGGDNDRACIRDRNWATCIPSPGNWSVGCYDRFRLTFTSASAIANYLPDVGVTSPLNKSALNPLPPSGAGYIGGLITEFSMMAHFDDCLRETYDTCTVPLRDHYFCDPNLVPGHPCSWWMGFQFDQFLDDGNQFVGRCYSPFVPNQFTKCAPFIKAMFENGSISALLSPVHCDFVWFPPNKNKLNSANGITVPIVLLLLSLLFVTI